MILDPEDLEVLRTYPLTVDPEHTETTVEILIGQPYYSYVVKGPLGAAKSGLPIVKDSILGAFLAGGFTLPSLKK